MKKLIDADDLIAWAEIVPLTDDGGIDINDFEEKLKSMPTVDAIPIEFIQKRIDQLKEMNGRIFFANGGYTSPSDYEQWELERLIRDWRDSNE